MLKKIIFVYDDMVIPGGAVKSITGNKTFGNTIFKKKTLRSRVLEEVEKNPAIDEILTYSKEITVKEWTEKFEELKKDCVVVHMYSNFAVADREQFQILLGKARFVHQTMVAVDGSRIAMGIFENVLEYLRYFKSYAGKQESLSFEKLADVPRIEQSALVDLSDTGSFLNFITSGFDARFFNALQGDEYTVTKRSSNQKKIKSEYQFYYLLPEHMKVWFVMPYAYREDENTASYTMERFHTTDIAIRFVHGAVSLEEFDDILKRLFYFISIRDKKAVSDEVFSAQCRKLYIEKVEERMTELQKSKIYGIFNQNIANGTSYSGIPEVIDKYKMLYEKVMQRTEFEKVLVIGHGDLCFSNILYHRDTHLLKLIDPKGALSEEELFTNPYYDLAKLSHSICGRYDFFNNGLYDIKIAEDMRLQLEIEFDNRPYMEIFKKYLKNSNFDYLAVRLFEASLFLSMLPLHIDHVQKTFGFLLNGMKILEEVEACLKD